MLNNDYTWSDETGPVYPKVAPHGKSKEDVLVEKVEMYKLGDGRIFPSRAEAIEALEVGLHLAELDRFVDSIADGDPNAPGVYRANDGLYAIDLEDLPAFLIANRDLLWPDRSL